MYNIEQPLEYWRELYLCHANTKAFKNKVQTAKDRVSEFLDIGGKNARVMWSCGKDSTAMMHLVNDVYKVPAISEKDDMDFPNELQYLKDAVNLFDWSVVVVSPEIELWNVIHQFDFTDDIHSNNTKFSSDFFYSLLKQEKEKQECKAVFLGLRAEESKGRRINAVTQRHIYYNLSWKELICQPIWDWSGKDVFAYLFSNDIPIMDVYFKTKFVNSPEDIRKSWILPSAQTSQGQAMWLKYYYPDIFNKLASINPKMKAYV
jgi:3'-phosphoadenosine 5'-phosphosulfate sulfotransferase (PAPS reductase)/FAD synthetase